MISLNLEWRKKKGTFREQQTERLKIQTANVY